MEIKEKKRQALTHPHNNNNMEHSVETAIADSCDSKNNDHKPNALNGSQTGANGLNPRGACDRKDTDAIILSVKNFGPQSPASVDTWGKTGDLNPIQDQTLDTTHNSIANGSTTEVRFDMFSLRGRQQNDRNDEASVRLQEFLPEVSAKQDSEEAKLNDGAQRGKSVCFFILNTLCAFFYIGPCVVGFWSSTWILTEKYVFPSDCVKAGITCASFGFSFLIFCSIFQTSFLNYTTSCGSGFCARVLPRVYTYVTSMASVAQWIAVWGLEVCWFDSGHWEVEVATLATASSILLLMRCHSMTLSPPVTIQMDTPIDVHYKITTFLSTKPGTLASIPDALLSVCVVLTLVISVWKSTWSLIDLWVFPDDGTISAVASLAISYGIAFTLLALQEPCKRLSSSLEQIHWFAKLVFEDALTMLFTFVAINHWRGYWMLLDIYLPYQPASMFLCHGLSFLLLAIGLTANSIIVRGCARDGMLSNGEGVVFDMFYITHMYEAYKDWKDDQSDHLPRCTSAHKRLSIDITRRLSEERPHRLRTDGNGVPENTKIDTPSGSGND